MAIRDKLLSSGLTNIDQAVVTISSATTTNFDFGTPNDINLVGHANYKPGDRLLVVFSAVTSGSTDTVSFDVQDAEDDGTGSPDTFAAATVDNSTDPGGTGPRHYYASVVLQPNRPWIRCRVTSDGATDTFSTACAVLAVPRSI